MTILLRMTSIRPFACYGFLCLMLACGGITGAQSTGTTQLRPGGDKKKAVLDGIVLNAITNQPVARALVQLDSSSVLTEHDGKFQFDADIGTSETLRVSKPGYYDGPDQNPVAKRITFSSASPPVKIYLFPEGLITGSLTAPNGDPLPGVYVQAFRKSGDESGNSWSVAGQTSTNSDGLFRLPLSAGDYVVETQYMADPVVPRQAIMPAIAPDPSNGSAAAAPRTMHVGSGAEEHLVLRPELRPTRDVSIRIDLPSSRGLPRIEAHLPNGLFFFPLSHQAATPGDLIATMPTGSYFLTMYTGDFWIDQAGPLVHTFFTDGDDADFGDPVRRGDASRRFKVDKSQS